MVVAAAGIAWLMYAQDDATPAASPPSRGPESSAPTADSRLDTSSTTVAPDPLHFDDEMLEAALAAGAADPIAGTGGRSTMASARLAGELASAGFDLTALEITVYKSGSGPAILAMETSDSTVLFTDDEAAEPFMIALLASPTVAEYEIDRLIFEHIGSDDDGPYTMTMTVRLADLREASETGENINDRVAVQLERP